MDPCGKISQLLMEVIRKEKHSNEFTSYDVRDKHVTATINLRLSTRPNESISLIPIPAFTLPEDLRGSKPTLA